MKVRRMLMKSDKEDKHNYRKREVCDNEGEVSDNLPVQKKVNK